MFIDIFHYSAKYLENSIYLVQKKAIILLIDGNQTSAANRSYHNWLVMYIIGKIEHMSCMKINSIFLNTVEKRRGSQKTT